MKKSNQDLDILLSRFQQLKLLVVGDVMIDRYLLGSVSRISPEAPVPVMQYESSESRPGGAANVALNIHELGATARLCSIVGEEEEGQQFIDLLKSHKLNTDHIIRTKERITTVKTRVMAGAQHLLRVDREVNHDLSTAEIDMLFAAITSCVEEINPDAMLLQDYNKGVLTGELISKICGFAEEHNIMVSVDPKFNSFFDFRGANLFKPNLLELRAAVPFIVEISEQSLAKAASYVREKLQCELVLVTLADRGIFYDDGSVSRILPAHKRAIRDVCGAGDTVISVATLVAAAKGSPEEIAYWSNLGGSIICEYPGVVPLSKELFKMGNV